VANMNREYDIAVLRKIMVNCSSFYTPQAVSIFEDKETEG
jgi:hypothetical protein